MCRDTGGEDTRSLAAILPTGQLTPSPGSPQGTARRTWEGAGSPTGGGNKGQTQLCKPDYLAAQRTAWFVTRFPLEALTLWFLCISQTHVISCTQEVRCRLALLWDAHGDETGAAPRAQGTH